MMPLRMTLALHGAPDIHLLLGRAHMTATYSVTGTVDDLSRIVGVRHDLRQALELALGYERSGYRDIRIEAEGVVYSMAQFRMLVE